MNRVTKIMAAVVATGGVAAGSYFGLPHETEKPLRLPGTVETQEVMLGSKIGGRVAAVYVVEGQQVEPGQKIASFDDRELVARRDTARARLAAAEAANAKAMAGARPEEIAEAAAQTACAKARLDKLEVGPRQELRDQARHEFAMAQTELGLAESDFAREDRLGRAAAGSRKERDATSATLDRAASRVKLTKAAFDMQMHGATPEELAEARAERDRFAAHEKMLQNGTRVEDLAAAYAAVAEARAALSEAETNLTEAVVVAPERCVVEVLPVRAGALVPAGQSVARVLRADDLWVKVFVPATELGKLKLGQHVDASVDSHPGRRFAGEIVQIASVSEFTPRNVQSPDERRHQVFAVKVRIADAGGVFKSGMAAEVLVAREGGK